MATHVSEGEERTVKEEHDAEQHEERAKRGQPDADFYTRHAASSEWASKYGSRVLTLHVC